MLSKGDDYPIHQTPEPIAYVAGQRNFYDRYFFSLGFSELLSAGGLILLHRISALL